MPFTPAHAAAVLPLRRTSLPLAALVCGSMAPDVPYYTTVVPWLSSSSRLTHSLLGTITLDIPLALLLLAIWTALTPPLVALAPSAVRASTAGLRPGWSWSVLPAAWIGALTHVFWDNWTHDYGFFVRHLAVLQDDLGSGVAVYDLLQQLSSVAGLLVIALATARWSMRTPRRRPPPGLAPRTRLGVVVALGLVAAGETVRRGIEPLHWGLHGPRLARAVTTQAAVGLVEGLAAAVAVYALLWWVFSRPRRRVSPATSPAARSAPRSQG